MTDSCMTNGNRGRTEEGTQRQERTALVTGASGGIGRAIAVELAKAGFHIIINYAGNEQGARETEEQIRAVNPGVKTLVHCCDVSSEEQVQAMVAAALELTGRIDVLVNNAGITRDNLLLRMSAEDFDLVISRNLRGAFLTAKYAGKQMLKQRYGRIVNISSVVALRGNPGQVNYAASKAGLIGLTKSAAREYAARGITVNAVAPGYIGTRMTEALPAAAREKMLQEIPVGRMGKPEEVARAVCFLSGEEAGYITGQVLCVDGGLGM